MDTKPDFDPGTFSFETRRLIDQALAVEADRVWTYAAMSEAIERSVTGSTPPLQTALKRLSRDHGIEFKNVRGLGYLRLDDAGIVEMAPIDRRSIKRRVGRAIQRSANVKHWEALSDHYKRELDAHRSLIGVLRHLVKPSTVKLIRSEVDRASDQIDLERTLALFRRKPPDQT